MSAFGPRKLTGRRLSGAGGFNGGNGIGPTPDARPSTDFAKLNAERTRGPDDLDSINCLDA
ncbi:hypothetical protein [Burkholderia lata]|jgi:hypothetical protein|uniref:hypothetical protein n=1 Tax=Burkholderia lata (strain ATCC 17760 / DSM 23089 / LMG 22485 / NCIMB 9086 / R18194 / 383) TaxID=482957 RepID=UPI00158227DC|nr:hypothetical protein [Burkholderia lata]